MDAVVRSGRPAGRADVCRPSLVCRTDQAGFVPSPTKRRRCRCVRRHGGLGARFCTGALPHLRARAARWCMGVRRVHGLDRDVARRRDRVGRDRASIRPRGVMGRRVSGVADRLRQSGAIGGNQGRPGGDAAVKAAAQTHAGPAGVGVRAPPQVRFQADRPPRGCGACRLTMACRRLRRRSPTRSRTCRCPRPACRPNRPRTSGRHSACRPAAG